MKLLFVSHSAELGGAERSLVQITRVALARGHEVDVTVPGGGPLCGVLTNMGVGFVHSVPTHRWMSRRGAGPAGWVRLIQCALDVPFALAAVRSSRPDVIVVNSSVTPAGMIAGQLLGIPTVTVIRELVRSQETLGSALSKDTLLHLLHSWSDRTIAVSRCVADETGADLVVHSTVTPFRLDRTPRDGSSRTLRAVYVGALTADKRPGDAVEAVRLAVDAGADYRLDLYGTGTNDEVVALQTRMATSQLGDRVTHHGEVSGPGAALSRADVFLMTSTAEAFGRVTVEALMAGVPVVGYDAGGTREILEVGGGVLVVPSPAAVAEVLIRWASHRDELSQLKAEASRAGKEWAEFPSDDLMVDIIEKVATSGDPIGRDRSSR